MVKGYWRGWRWPQADEQPNCDKNVITDFEGEIADDAITYFRVYMKRVKTKFVPNVKLRTETAAAGSCSRVPLTTRHNYWNGITVHDTLKRSLNGYEVGTKYQYWRSKYARQVRKNMKAKLPVLYFNGLVHHYFLPQGQAINNVQAPTSSTPFAWTNQNKTPLFMAQ